MKFIIACSLALLTSVSFASETAPPKAATCAACHGANGDAPIMDVYPKINGQNKGYLISALKDYKAGNRNGALSAVMSSQAKMLTDEEIEALAAFYSAK